MALADIFEGWETMSEFARKAVVRLTYARFEELHHTCGDVGAYVVESSWDVQRAEPEEQRRVLAFMFELFGVQL